METLNQDKQ